jgi:Fur family transcriptional regulator, iron response regulator
MAERRGDGGEACPVKIGTSLVASRRIVGVNMPPITAIDWLGPSEYILSNIKGRDIPSRTVREVGVRYKDRQGSMQSKPVGADIENRIREAGLRPTRQRLSLAHLLFAKGDRHLSAEELHEEAVRAGVAVSLATVYNTLHQFTDAGLLRILSVEGSRTYFDTNTSDHHHFFIEGENRVMDIEHGPVTVTNLPEPPPGMEVANVDIIVRLRPKRPD